MDSRDIKTINDMVQAESALVETAMAEIGRVIVGQKYMVERILIGLFTGGHILVEGVPGLAKTLAIKTTSEVIAAKFNRIQFTPDLLPADLVGTLIFNQTASQFVVRKGPVFANLVLADEINRAPAGPVGCSGDAGAPGDDRRQTPAPRPVPRHGDAGPD